MASSYSLCYLGEGTQSLVLTKLYWSKLLSPSGFVLDHALWDEFGQAVYP